MKNINRLYSERSERGQSTGSTSCNSPDIKSPKKTLPSVDIEYRKYNLPLTKLIDSSIKKARRLSLDPKAQEQPFTQGTTTSNPSKKKERPYRKTFLITSFDLNPLSPLKNIKIKDKYKPSRFIEDPDIRKFSKKLPINRKLIAQDLALLKSVKFEKITTDPDIDSHLSENITKPFMKQLTQDWKWRTPDTSPKDPRRVSFF